MPNRNEEINVSALPALYTNRSRHHYYKNIKTSGNEGDLIIFYANELVQPADTFNINCSFVGRTQTPYQPVMDDAYYDIYLFTLPWHDAWDNANAFFGENPNSAWANTTQYTTPRIKVPANATISKDDILAYMGFRQGALGNEYTVGGGMTVTTYNFIWNEYFRDQNYIAPKQLDTTGATITFDTTDSLKGGKVLKVAKFHDRFTSGLPDVASITTLPIGTTAPVVTHSRGEGFNWGNTYPIVFKPSDGSNFENNIHQLSLSEPLDGLPDAAKTISQNWVGNGTVKEVAPINLYADLTSAVAATLNAQRVAIAINHIEEKLGLYGRRYREIVRSGWSVTPSDTAMHIPEYLGGKRILMGMNQVVNSTEGTNNSVLGSTGGYSLTTDIFELCNKSFVEHSILIGVMCLRCEQHNGAQGLDRQYLKSLKYDYYWDELAGLGFQPVYNGELFFQGIEATDMTAHHFLPSWDEYRRETDSLTGEFSPDYSQWLKEWTYARKLTNLPIMSQQWIEEDTVPMDRTLTVTSSAAHNYIVDIQLEITKYSITKQHGLPGIDKL